MISKITQKLNTLLGHRDWCLRGGRSLAECHWASIYVCPIHHISKIRQLKSILKKHVFLTCGMPTCIVGEIHNARLKKFFLVATLGNQAWFTWNNASTIFLTTLISTPILHPWILGLRLKTISVVRKRNWHWQGKL